MPFLPTCVSISISPSSTPSLPLPKAFTGYLGAEDREAWKAYDACELLRRHPKGGPAPPILVDQGSADSFLQAHLLPATLEAAAREAGYPGVTLRMQEGYDHSYFFISSFVDDHLDFHAKHLLK